MLQNKPRCRTLHLVEVVAQLRLGLGVQELAQAGDPVVLVLVLVVPVARHCLWSSDSVSVDVLTSWSDCLFFCTEKNHHRKEKVVEDKSDLSKLRTVLKNLIIQIIMLIIANKLRTLLKCTSYNLNNNSYKYTCEKILLY